MEDAQPVETLDGKVSEGCMLTRVVEYGEFPPRSSLRKTYSAY